jgi:hypothetical protein
MTGSFFAIAHRSSYRPVSFGFEPGDAPDRKTPRVWLTAPITARFPVHKCILPLNVTSPPSNDILTRPASRSAFPSQGTRLALSFNNLAIRAEVV